MKKLIQAASLVLLLFAWSNPSKAQRVFYHIGIDPSCFQSEDSAEPTRLFYKVRSLNSERRLDKEYTQNSEMLDNNSGDRWSRVELPEPGRSYHRIYISNFFNLPYSVDASHLKDKIHLVIKARPEGESSLSFGKLVGWPDFRIVSSCILDFSINPAHENWSDVAYCPSARIIGPSIGSCSQAVKFFVTQEKLEPEQLDPKSE